MSGYHDDEEEYEPYEEDEEYDEYEEEALAAAGRAGPRGGGRPDRHPVQRHKGVQRVPGLVQGPHAAGGGPGHGRGIFERPAIASPNLRSASREKVLAEVVIFGPSFDRLEDLSLGRREMSE